MTMITKITDKINLFVDSWNDQPLGDKIGTIIGILYGLAFGYGLYMTSLVKTVSYCQQCQ